MEAKEGHDAISYLEGYQEGEKASRREVVEWLEQYHIKVLEGDPLAVPPIYSDCGYHIPTNILQAKLKEWGIEESQGSSTRHLGAMSNPKG